MYIQCSKNLPYAIQISILLSIQYPTNDLILHCLLLLSINCIMYMNVVILEILFKTVFTNRTYSKCMYYWSTCQYVLLVNYIVY